MNFHARIFPESNVRLIPNAALTSERVAVRGVDGTEEKEMILARWSYNILS